jgi:hypothetical protein
MTRDEKKDALTNEGIPFKGNISNENLDKLYAATFRSDTDKAESPAPAPVEGSQKLSNRQIDFEVFLEANQNKMLGDKTPVVVEWARANLSPDEFKARYEGRTLPV